MEGRGKRSGGWRILGYSEKNTLSQCAFLSPLPTRTLPAHVEREQEAVLPLIFPPILLFQDNSLCGRPIPTLRSHTSLELQAHIPIYCVLCAHWMGRLGGMNISKEKLALTNELKDWAIQRNHNSQSIKGMQCPDTSPSTPGKERERERGGGGYWVAQKTWLATSGVAADWKSSDIAAVIFCRVNH